MEGYWNIFWQESGIVGKAVLGILLWFSFFSWIIVFSKLFTFRKINKSNKKFYKLFKKSEKMYEMKEMAKRIDNSTFASIFLSIYYEIEKQFYANPETEKKLRWENIEKAHKLSSIYLLRNLKTGLPFLATTASATPFIGLFGTVWGIMNAFHKIGIAQSANLATVAPGISEALINTAAGLAVAIPALIFYNLFSSRIRSFEEELEEFGLEVQNFIYYKMK